MIRPGVLLVTLLALSSCAAQEPPRRTGAPYIFPPWGELVVARNDQQIAARDTFLEVPALVAPYYARRAGGRLAALVEWVDERCTRYFVAGDRTYVRHVHECPFVFRPGLDDDREHLTLVDRLGRLSWPDWSYLRMCPAQRDLAGAARPFFGDSCLEMRSVRMPAPAFLNGD